MAKIITADYNLDLEHPALDNMSDDEFFSFCVQNKNIRLERDENKQILIKAPVGNLTSYQNFEIAGQIFTWNKKTNLGFAFDSSAGFYLPDKSMRNPDAAWISSEKWKSIANEEKKKFAYLVPNFIIELMSPSDRLKPAKDKMKMWINNGVLLAWLINPENKTAYIYRINGTIEEVNGFDKKLSGEDILPGFELDLSILK
ncbi:MAG: Uma2 family endonuclease [Ginsengibacter sp.]